MVFRGFILLCFFSICALLQGQQDSVLLSKNFKFRDGIYLSFEDFKKNRPVYSWTIIEASMASNPQTFLAKVEYLKIDNGISNQDLELDEVWGFSLGGIPYLRLNKEEENQGFAVFTGLRVRGKICYFSYEGEFTKMVEISAFNPLTGRPFRTAKLPRKEKVLFEKMLNFSKGTIADFTVENFLDWIKEDKPLWTTIKELPPEEAKEKLFKSLLIYLDRNEVYIKY